MRIPVLVAVIIALPMAWAGSAFAKPKTPLEAQYEESARRAKQTDQEYDATMKRLGTKGPAPVTDPWKTVRPSAPSNGRN